MRVRRASDLEYGAGSGCSLWLLPEFNILKMRCCENEAAYEDWYRLLGHLPAARLVIAVHWSRLLSQTAACGQRTRLFVSAVGCV